ncbi:apoptotic chromatin condensation inducer in the nucleus [Elysia marginata]|uniref:Apoptotic chromatin condensation inducer in the nucleus n=1 Tax=Elysia marginata TaxID=1093978 RepID=A0AAV4K114_9GAST|nr:apoptotic chromatin condensation inducer in the nucleus [Elysia marginata]
MFFFSLITGKVPNMALQQESAGQSEFVRQYLEQQQRNLERQMEVKKQVEEERKRKSADESSADETVTQQDSSKPKVDPEVTSPKKFKDDSSNAPAIDESKMPRPARKSSRNASKGENGQESGVVKEKSRSPSPEKESLRERTRSGSSSSSRSATPEAAVRRGRSTRGARGGRRGGRRGRGRPHATRKGSRSSSHSSTEEEVMPKKRSRRSTNSRSSRSRSRSPSLKTSPELTPATRRSSRRISATKTPPDHDLSTTDPDIAQKPKESPVAKAEEASADDNLKSDVSKVLEVVHDAKAKDEKETKRSVEVLEPAESSIKNIEVADMKKVEDKEEIAVGTKTDETQSGAQTKAQDALSNKEKSKEISSELNMENDSKKPLTEQSNEHGLAGAKEQPPKESADKQKLSEAVSQGKSEQLPKQTKEDGSAASKRGRQRSGSSSSSSSSSSPPRKREANRERSDSSGSSTDVTPNVNVDSTKHAGERSRPETSSGDADKQNQQVLAQDQQPESNVELHAPNVSATVHGQERDDTAGIQKSFNDDSKLQSGTSSDRQEVSVPGNEKPEEEVENKELQEKAADKIDQAPKNDEESVSKKDKTAKKRKWGSKSSKTLPTATKKPTSMEISSDSLKNLIGEVKLSETVFDMETEVVNTLDYDEQEEDRRDVKVKRTVVKDSPSEPDAAEIAEDEDEEDARKVEASGDAPEQNDKQQEHEKIAEEDEEQSGDETEEQAQEPKKKLTKSSPSGEIPTKENGKKKVAKEGKKVKKKKITVGETTDGKENKVVATEKTGKESAKIVATTRPSKPILPMVDEPEKVAGRGDMSPARHPPDRVLRIAGLVRPFTVGQLKELLKRTGELDDEHFWINDIKSHCLAAFKTEDDAVKTRAALHGTRWPQSNPKILHVDFSTIEDLVHRKSGEGPPPALMRKNQEQRNQRELKQEPKKDSVPRDREVDERDARRRPSATEQGDKRKEGDKAVRERERPPQIREWDKDKMKQLSRSRSKSKERDRPLRRSRSRDRDQRKRRDGSREKREDDKKKEKRQKGRWI